MQFRLNDKENLIILTTSAGGKEVVRFNNKVVSEKRVISNGGTHEWEINGSHYVLTLKIGFLKGKVELIKDSICVDFIEGSSSDVRNIGNGTNKETEKKKELELYLFSIGFICLFFGVKILIQTPPKNFKGNLFVTILFLIGTISSVASLFVFKSNKKKK